MDEKKFDKIWGKPRSLYAILTEMNDEIERLKKFAKNMDAFGGKKIYPGLVDISSDTRKKK
jgi:hypothetical protein